MDKVFIEALEIECVIGIYDWERKIRQPVVLDLEMDFDNRRPAATDAIADTLDYKAVSKRLIQFVSESEFGLVETLAERCAAIVREEFGVRWLRLKLSKPGAVRADIARGFEDAVVETLAIKCERALRQTGDRTLVVAGGVGANVRLRARLKQIAEKLGGRVCFPRPEFCTDNGAMIAFAGALRLQAGQREDAGVHVVPRWDMASLRAV